MIQRKKEVRYVKVNVKIIEIKRTFSNLESVLAGDSSGPKSRERTATVEFPGRERIDVSAVVDAGDTTTELWFSFTVVTTTSLLTSSGKKA
jgi:hypothetical protein